MAAVRSARMGLPGLLAQLFIGVPYAEKVNEMDSHAGYVEVMQEDFVRYITGRLEFMRNLVIRR